MIQVGQITSTHGIKGEVKIYSSSDFNRFFVGQTLFINIKDTWTPFEIKTSRMHKNLHIVSFNGYDNINHILHLIKSDVYIKDASNLDLGEDDYHYQSLIGKKVITKDQNIVGTVTSMIEVPQGHLMEIENTEGKRKLIPFVKAFIGEIDEDSITVFPIEGLL